MTYTIADVGSPGVFGRSKTLASTISLHKLKTYAWIRAHTNLTTPKVYHGNDPVNPWGPYALLSAHGLRQDVEEFVIKPIYGSRGVGVRALHKESPASFRNVLGQVRLIRDLANELFREADEARIKNGWFSEELIRPHESQKELLELPMTALTLRYWFYDGRFLGGVWMAAHSGSEGRVIFQKNVHWGWFNYDGVMTQLHGQRHFLESTCHVNGKDYTGFKILGAGGPIVDALGKLAKIWKPGGTLRIDGFVNQDLEWVFGEIETNQRAPTVTGCPRNMKLLEGLGKP